MMLCPRVAQNAPETFGDVLKNYDELLDLYTDCRLRHNALVEFEREKK